MSSTQFDIQGLNDIEKKLKALNNPKKVKSLVRKALRQAANVVKDAARQNAKAIDDPETREKIWKNIGVASGRSRNSGSEIMRIGVRGGASFSNPVPPRLSGGDTRHWRWIEYGSVNSPSVPFMRPALSNNTRQVTDTFVRVLNEEIEKVLS
ncbi:hypothetical protein CDG60_08695 [Acinetobacter chinensis]|uniref:HK97 gp10 family phage protein n=1 Tax=Acinetobacter chinensis TaxID=2004650 RepID=A0A3B7LUV2_9GAMM|nr:HK97-gp10 family putative phage morphogenesis protein [Acinetobacter chinensis]AXY56640.1 hypothetical protein CDG60_08695 [Acinetobacter chinensis]